MTHEIASRPTPPDLAAAVDAALFVGKKIEAIKRYRQAHAVDLATAKREVEAIEASLRQSDPARFMYPASASGGCGLGTLVLLVLFVIGATLAGFVLRWPIHSF